MIPSLEASTCLFRGGMMVESVTEHFYASMGVNRLRGYLTTFGEGVLQIVRRCPACVLHSNTQ